MSCWQCEEREGKGRFVTGVMVGKLGAALGKIAKELGNRGGEVVGRIDSDPHYCLSLAQTSIRLLSEKEFNVPNPPRLECFKTIDIPRRPHEFYPIQEIIVGRCGIHRISPAVKEKIKKSAKSLSGDSRVDCWKIIIPSSHAEILNELKGVAQTSWDQVLEVLSRPLFLGARFYNFYVEGKRVEARRGNKGWHLDSVWEGSDSRLDDSHIIFSQGIPF